MTKLIRTDTILGIIFTCLGSSGCTPSSPSCSGEDTQSLVIQILKERLLAPRPYGDDLLDSRHRELEDQTLVLDGITTVQHATPQRPQSLCEARLLVGLYDVGRNYDSLKAAAPSQSTSEAMQERLEAFKKNPANLQRLGERRQMEFKVSYSASFTDDGRPTVRVEAH